MTNDFEMVYVGPDFVTTINEVGENLKGKGIVYSNAQCEILFDSKEDIVRINGLDIIAAFRICEMLPYFNRLDDEIIVLLMEATKWINPNGMKIISERIGKDAYDEVMARKIPEQIIQAIIKEGSKEGNIYNLCDPDRITEEVRRENIPWSEEFRKFGIRTPEAFNQNQVRIREVVAPYESLLASYLDFNEVASGFGDFIREVMAAALEKKITNGYSDAMIVAVSGVSVLSVAFHVRTGHLDCLGSSAFQIAVFREVKKAETWLKRHGTTCSDKEFMKALFAFQKIL